jgi:adenine-specific DNA-methyltransferase
MSLVEKGFVRAPRPATGSIAYLKAGERKKVEGGDFEITGRAADGSILAEAKESKRTVRILPGDTWVLPSHDAGVHGTRLVTTFLQGRRFPFPKSLYAVEDALRFFVKDKPHGVVLDFFSGSGTTAHAVMRLNKQDGGRRQSILVTNNEVSVDEQKALQERGLRAGDVEWEQWGICELITKPRIEAAISGRTPDGGAIEGDYKFTDEFPFADGFEENVEFFTLTYEAPLRVALHREFGRIAPLVWMRAGSRGRRIEDVSGGWDVADAFGVLADLDHTEEFLKAVANTGDDFTTAFIVTDEDRLFESIARDLPDHVEPVRLYESYLRNFEIESGRGTM